METEKIFDSIVYFDIGAYAPFQGQNIWLSPFENNQNDVYLQKKICFDPNFTEVYRESGKYIYYNCAVLDKNSDNVKFYMSKDPQNSALFMQNKEKHNTEYDAEWVHTIDEKIISCRELCGLVEENGGEIDIVKIDAHGSEYRILKSAGKYLSDIILIQVEMWFDDFYIDSFHVGEINSFLLESGFEPVKVVNGGRGKWIDVLYINRNTTKTNKLNLIKNLYDLHNSKCLNTILDKNGKFKWLK